MGRGRVKKDREWDAGKKSKQVEKTEEWLLKTYLDGNVKFLV